MAATIAGTPTKTEIRILFLDEADEPRRAVWVVSATSAAIQTALDALAALTNAIIDVTVAQLFDVTGIATDGKPAATSQSLVAAICALDFIQPNPLNSAKTIQKQVAIPAYINSIRNDAVKPHVPVTGNSNLDALTAFLAASLVYVDVAGTNHVGGWTYSNATSKFGTNLTVTDGY